MKHNTTMEDRFWTRVQKRGEQECWDWNGAKSLGYGFLKEKGGSRKIYAHRLSYELYANEIPAREDFFA